MPADVESGSMNASQRPMMGLDSVETLVEDYSPLSKRDRAEVRNRGWGSGIGLREPAAGSVAAPIRRGELFAIAVFGTEPRLQDADRDKLARLLLGQAQDLKVS